MTRNGLLLTAALALHLSCGGDSLTGSNTPAPPDAGKESAKKPPHSAPPPAAKAGAVQVGLDVLETETPPRLAGKKVGLVLNAANLTTYVALAFM